MSLGDQLDDHLEQLAITRDARESEKPLLDEIKRLEREVAELREALRTIQLRADSDACAEELEDAQSDLRFIHMTATSALKPHAQGGSES